jgi:hypothetical protein
MLGFGLVIGNYVSSPTFNHSEFLISGEPIKQVAKIDKVINPGEKQAKAAAARCCSF